MRSENENFEDRGMIRWSDLRFEGWLRKNLAPAQLNAWLDAAVLPDADVRHDGRKVRVVRVDSVFVKLYKCRHLFDALRRRFKTPRSIRSLSGQLALLAAGAATPPVLVALRGRGRYPDLLITESAPENARFCDKAAENMAPGEAAAGLCRFAARIHAHGIVHGDLSLRNLYFAGDETGAIDLDGCRILEKVPAELRRRETARLASSYMAAACGGDFDLEAARAFRNAYCGCCNFDVGNLEFEREIRRFLAHGGKR